MLGTAYNQIQGDGQGQSSRGPVGGVMGGGSAGGQTNTPEPNDSRKIIGYDANGNAIFASDNPPTPVNPPSGQPTGPIIGYDANGNAIFQSDNPPTPVPGYAPPSAPSAPPAVAMPQATPIDRADYQLPGGDALLQQLRDRAAGIQGRTQDTDVRGQQMALANLLQRYSTGQDSVSALQLKQASDANIANQMAMAAGARPGQAQLAGLTAAQQAGSIGTALAGQQSIAGIQERRSAQDALNSVLGATRGQDLQFSGQNDQAYQQALAQQLATSQLMQQGNQGYSTNLAMQQLSQQQLAQQAALANLQAQTQLALGGKDSAGLLQSAIGAGAQGLAWLNQQRSNPDSQESPV